MKSEKPNVRCGNDGPSIGATLRDVADDGEKRRRGSETTATE